MAALAIANELTSQRLRSPAVTESFLWLEAYCGREL